MVLDQPMINPSNSPNPTAMPNPASVVHSVWIELTMSARRNSTKVLRITLGVGST